MKLAVLGLWHLGTVTAACTAAAGFPTVAIDDDASNIVRLKNGEPPLYEPGLAELVKEGLARGTLSFTTDLAALADVDVVWVCHDTPVDEDDHADVEHVFSRVEATFDHLRDGAVVLVSAQLPVGTVARLERAFAGRVSGRTVGFACTPENLRLGRAIEVFRNPGRIVVGTRDARTRAVLAPLLQQFCANLIWMSVESAEMAKHALNAFLAVSVTFTNELASICERVGADANEVEAALRTDPRVGKGAYVRAGAAFAGGTLARDIQFLSMLAKDNSLEMPLIGGVIPSNGAHRLWAHRQLARRLAPLAGRRIALLGLAYKPGTEALRRSAAVELLRMLVADGATVSAFDPAVRALPPEFRNAVSLAATATGALNGAEAAVICTEWPEFRTLSAQDFSSSMSGQLVLDPGRCLGAQVFADPALTVVSVGMAS
jgi:UDPglucose 6-dehydrogenase